MSMTDVQIASLALHEVNNSSITAFSEKTAILLQQRYEQVRDSLLSRYHWKFAKRRTRILSAGTLNCSSLTITITGNTAPTSDTIVRDSGSFITDGFRSGDRVTLTGSASNNNTYNVLTAAALTLTLDTYEAATTEILTSDTDLKIYANPASRWNYKYARPSDCLNVVDINERLFGTRTFSQPYIDGEEVIQLTEPKWDIEGNYIVTNDIDTNDQILVEYVEQVTDTTLFTPIFIRLLTLELAADLVRPLKQDPVIKKNLMEQARIERFDYLQQMSSEGNPDQKRGDTSWQRAGRRGPRNNYGRAY